MLGEGLLFCIFNWYSNKGEGLRLPLDFDHTLECIKKALFIIIFLLVLSNTLVIYWNFKRNKLTQIIIVQLSPTITDGSKFKQE